MKRKNILFALLTFLTILLIVLSLLSSIHHRVYRKVLSESLVPNRPTVSLTFDDGPNSLYTPQILDVLYEQQVPATFFIVGEKLSGNKWIIQEIASSGHEIESHTFSHTDLTTLTPVQIHQELLKNQAALKKFLPDYAFQFLRPPYGKYNQIVEQSANLPLALWTIDSEDWKNANPDTICSTVLKNICDGDIVVFHDDNPATIIAVKTIIKELKERGFQFATISQMFVLYPDSVK